MLRTAGSRSNLELLALFEEDPLQIIAIFSFTVHLMDFNDGFMATRWQGGSTLIAKSCQEHDLFINILNDVDLVIKLPDPSTWPTLKQHPLRLSANSLISPGRGTIHEGHLRTLHKMPCGTPRRGEEAASILILLETSSNDSPSSPPNKGDPDYKTMPVPRGYMHLKPPVPPEALHVLAGHRLWRHHSRSNRPDWSQTPWSNMVYCSKTERFWLASSNMFWGPFMKSYASKSECLGFESKGAKCYGTSSVILGAPPWTLASNSWPPGWGTCVGHRLSL